MRKNLKMVAVLAAATLSAVAGAQSWEDQNGTYTLKGCFSAQGNVQCDLTFTLTKQGNSSFTYTNSNIQFFTTDGQTGSAYKVSLAGRSFTYQDTINIVQDVPIKFSFTLPLSANTKVIRAVVIAGKRLDNVPVSGNGSTAPAPVVSVPNNGGTPNGFQVMFSNCKLSSGMYTCTATLTPVK